MTTSMPGGFIASRTERALLLAAQRADHRAQDELVRRYEPLVQATLRQMALPARLDREDLAQEARLALFAAIRAWRPGLGAFAALAERCITNRLIMTFNYAGRHKQRVLDHALSLDAPRGRDDDDQLTLLDVLPSSTGDPEQTAIVNAQLAAIIAALPKLTTREYTALQGSLNARLQQDLAVEHATTAKAIHLNERRARRKLAKEPIFACA